MCQPCKNSSGSHRCYCSHVGLNVGKTPNVENGNTVFKPRHLHVSHSHFLTSLSHLLMWPSEGLHSVSMFLLVVSWLWCPMVLLCLLLCKLFHCNIFLWTASLLVSHSHCYPDVALVRGRTFLSATSADQLHICSVFWCLGLTGTPVSVKQQHHQSSNNIKEIT